MEVSPAISSWPVEFTNLLLDIRKPHRFRTPQQMRDKTHRPSNRDAQIDFITIDGPFLLACEDTIRYLVVLVLSPSQISNCISLSIYSTRVDYRLSMTYRPC